jgi:hypothetical protein
MKEECVVSIKEQCVEAGVPFFFKQWGGIHKKAYGRSLRGRTYDGFPKRIKNPVLPASIRQQHANTIDASSLVRLSLAPSAF